MFLVQIIRIQETAFSSGSCYILKEVADEEKEREEEGERIRVLGDVVWRGFELRWCGEGRRVLF